MLKVHNKKVEHAKRFADFIFKKKKGTENHWTDYMSWMKICKKLKKETDTNELQVRANNRKKIYFLTFSPKKKFSSNQLSQWKKKH